MPDVDFLAETLTRGQVERLRGPLANGNGAGDLVAPVLNGRAAPSANLLSTASLTPEPARTCDGCGFSLEGRRPSARWCSAACKKRAASRAKTRPARTATRPTPGNKPASVAGFPLTQPVPSAPGILDQLVALVVAVPAGVKVTVEVSGATIVCCRP